MSDPTPVTEEVTPPSAETPQPSEQEPTETVEELKARLAAAEEEAKRWKGRVAEENPKKKPAISEEDLDWKIANTNRVGLVKEAYEKELRDLEESGAKITNALRTKALEYAESKLLSKPATESSNSSLPTPSVDRTGSQAPRLNEYDQAMGVNPEIIKEYSDYVEGR